MTSRKMISTKLKALLAATAATMGVAACSPAAGSNIPQPSPGPAHTADGAFTLIQEPQAGYSSVVSMINNAAKSFRLTIYELAAPDVEAALIAAHQRGVDVRVLLDQAFHGKQTNQSAYDKLTTAGVAARWAPPGRIVHEKAWVTDTSTAVVSTANLDNRYFATSRDAMIQITDKEDVAAIAATFDSDYAQAAT